MKPYYEEDNITIYNADCLEVMSQLDKVDLVITSPPYNLGNKHHTGNYYHKTYNDDLPERDYQESQIKVLNELHNVIKDSGSLFYNHKNRIKDGLQTTPYEWLLKTNWLMKQELVWFNRSQNFDKIRFYPMTERVYWLVKDPKTKLTNNINHHDLFEWQTVGSKGEFKRAFPEQMVSDILRCFPEAMSILDPYFGSGTVGFVAKKLGRKCVGIEKNREYCDIAINRLKNTQKDMFL